MTDKRKIPQKHQVKELAARYYRLLELDKKCPYNTAHIHLAACYATLPASSHSQFELEVNDIISKTGDSSGN
jgi:hypothetical protein